MKFKGNVTIVFDGQAGSCGKGKFIGQFAFENKIDISINNNMPNAGHTFVFDEGRRVTTSHLPVAMVSPNTRYLMIGAAAAIAPEKLYSEMEEYSDILGNRKIYIHERAAVVLPKHIKADKKIIKSVSTFKGTASANV